MPRHTPRKVATAVSVPMTASTLGRFQNCANVKYRRPVAGRVTWTKRFRNAYTFALKSMRGLFLLGYLILIVTNTRVDVETAIAVNNKAWTQNIIRMSFGLQNANNTVMLSAPAKETACNMNGGPIWCFFQGRNEYKTGTAVAPTAAITTITRSQARNTSISRVI